MPPQKVPKLKTSRKVKPVRDGFKCCRSNKGGSVRFTTQISNLRILMPGVISPDNFTSKDPPRVNLLEEAPEAPHTSAEGVFEASSVPARDNAP